MAEPPPTPVQRVAEWDEVVRALLFWCFVGVALVLFAACVLLPEWRETQSFIARRDAMAAQVAALERRVAKRQRVAEALRSDPSVIARRAERELNYRRLDEEEVLVTPDTHRAVRAARREPARPLGPGPALPPWLAARVPAGAWVDIFHDSPDRQVCMVLSAILLVSAFWLFPPRRTERVPAE